MGSVKEVLGNPQHPYTKHLIAAEPKGLPIAPDPNAETVVSAEHVKVYFPIQRGFLRRTVDHVALSMTFQLASSAATRSGSSANPGPERRRSAWRFCG